MKVGMIAPPWTKDTCQCGAEYYMTRAYEKVLTNDDMYCSRCCDAFKLDLTQRDLENARKFISRLVDVANELNYRLRKTDESEGFYHDIELAQNFLEETK